jgi:hypothetical protein
MSNNQRAHQARGIDSEDEGGPAPGPPDSADEGGPAPDGNGSGVTLPPSVNTPSPKRRACVCSKCLQVGHKSNSHCSDCGKRPSVEPHDPGCSNEPAPAPPANSSWLGSAFMVQFLFLTVTMNDTDIPDAWFALITEFAERYSDFFIATIERGKSFSYFVF